MTSSVNVVGIELGLVRSRRHGISGYEITQPITPQTGPTTIEMPQTEGKAADVPSDG